MRSARARLSRLLGSTNAQLSIDSLQFTLSQPDVLRLAQQLERVLASYAREMAAAGEEER